MIRHFTRSMYGAEDARRGRGQRLARPCHPAVPAEGAYIDFRGRRHLETVSSRAAGGDVDPKLLRGRTVVVGASAPTLHDRHATAAGNEPMAGPEVQANAIWTLLHGASAARRPRLACSAPVAGMSVFVPLMALWVRPLIAALTVARRRRGLRGVAPRSRSSPAPGVPVVAPLFGLALAAVATVAASHVLETVARHRIADATTARAEVRDAELEIIQPAATRSSRATRRPATTSTGSATSRTGSGSPRASPPRRPSGCGAPGP